YLAALLICSRSMTARKVPPSPVARTEIARIVNRRIPFGKTQRATVHLQPEHAFGGLGSPRVARTRPRLPRPKRLPHLRRESIRGVWLRQIRHFAAEHSPALYHLVRISGNV